MIQEFVDVFMAKKHILEKKFEKTPPKGYMCLVREVISLLKDHIIHYVPDPERIHVIDGGEDPHGVFLIIIGSKGHAPDHYWNVNISYGSCSFCDTFQSIRSSYAPNKLKKQQQLKDYMTLALHIVQGLKEINLDAICLKKVIQRHTEQYNERNDSMLQSTEFYRLEGETYEEYFTRLNRLTILCVVEAEAQNCLGEIYENDCLYQDGAYNEKAVKWYQHSAKQGYAEGQKNLGSMYRMGKGVDEDDQKAVEWYRKAAEQENAEAEYYLGLMYEQGLGVPQDGQRVIEWYGKAAEHGNTEAQCKLGSMYVEGLVVKQDNQKALEWYRKAAEQGDSQAKYYLEDLLETLSSSNVQEPGELH